VPKPPGQSDFVFGPKDDEGPPDPEAGASPRATRWVLGIAFSLIFIVAALCAIALHIPSGE
jgi:hypothetical protein